MNRISLVLWTSVVLAAVVFLEVWNAVTDDSKDSFGPGKGMLAFLIALVGLMTWWVVWVVVVLTAWLIKELMRQVRLRRETG